MNTPREELDSNARTLLRQCLSSLQNEVAQRVQKHTQEALNLTPAPVDSFIQDIRDLSGQLQITPLPGLEQRHVALLKTALLQMLQVQSTGVEERSRLTPDPDTKAVLEAELEPLNEMLAKPWIKASGTITVPRLSDYLVPAQLFLPDLRHYRLQSCELRDRSVTVAYVDIDEFKSFNTDFSEPRIDKELLPRFMRILEVAVYGRGHAYRFGGDEYILLFPNCGTDDAVRIVCQLQADLAAAQYGNIHRCPTISVGLCEVRRDWPWTDRQVEQLAANAKNHAKDKGRNRIVGYIDYPPTARGLDVLHEPG